MRTPEETRLEQIALFFDKTVEYMRRDNRPPISGAPSLPIPMDEPPYLFMSTPELLAAMGRDKMKAIYQVEVSVSSVRFLPCCNADNVCSVLL